MKSSLKLVIVRGLIIVSIFLCFVYTKEISYATNKAPIVVINGENLISDPKPLIRSDRLMLPLRALLNSLEVSDDDINWVAETRQVLFTQDSKTVILTVDSTAVFVNGVLGNIDVPSFIYMDRVFIPVRFVSETLDNEVAWDEKTKTAYINSKRLEDQSKPASSLVLSSNDIGVSRNVELGEVDAKKDPGFSVWLYRLLPYLDRDLLVKLQESSIVIVPQKKVAEMTHKENASACANVIKEGVPGDKIWISNTSAYSRDHRLIYIISHELVHLLGHYGEEIPIERGFEILNKYEKANYLQLTPEEDILMKEQS